MDTLSNLNPSVPQSLSPSIPQSLNPSVPQSFRSLAVKREHDVLRGMTTLQVAPILCI